MSRRASLFLTCSADLLYPEAGRAAVRALEAFGVAVDFPSGQTCCGQAWANAGQPEAAKGPALHFLDIFAESHAVVAPSASCVDTIRNTFPVLFEDDPGLAARFRDLGGRTFEVCEYLHRVVGVTQLPRLPRPPAVTYHSSCRTLRGLGFRDVPEAWLRCLAGEAFRPLPPHQAQACCGFGGTFSVKLPEISGRLMEEKLRALVSTGAERVTSLDLGCLTHLAGGAARRGLALGFAHVVELVAEALEEGAP
ncbi:MAG: (Fe-S)-binding protein [Deferrisomatales bacterium]|nr:(Fe-S)-binding protein [Deferrisomatales bacterium]